MPATKPLLALLAASLLLGGCDSTLNKMRERRLGPYTTAPQATVAPSALTTSLQAAPGGGFTPESLANLNSLLQAQGRLHAQTLTLRPFTPTGERLAQRLAAVLREQGANPQQVIVAPVALKNVGNTAEWDLQVISEALVVKTPDCSIANSQAWSVQPFQATGPLGCANRSNIARMVADPRDLSRPQALDAGDGTAAVNAVGRYHTDKVRELLDIDFQQK